MSETNLEQLATFMGHTEQTHRQFYRLPDNVIQTSKISKILLLAENGGDISKYKGKNLDEIEIETENIEEVLEEEEDDERDNSNIAEDFVLGKPASCAKVMKKNKGRELVPFTDEQKQILLDYFKKYIKKKICPKKVDIQKCVDKYAPLFQNKNWIKLKAFISNRYKAKPGNVTKKASSKKSKK